MVKNMVKFEISRYKHNASGNCFLSLSDIDDITENLLKDYKPTLLTDPQAVDFDDFIGSYLGYEIDYQHIFYNLNEPEILGCALFDKQKIKIFKTDHSGVEFLEYDENTIIIDRVLVDETDPSRHIQLVSTALHEAGHLYLQQEWGRANKDQINLFSPERKICCRKSDCEIFSITTSQQDKFREWQANKFAFAIALNKYALKDAFIDILRRTGIKQDVLIMDHFPESFYRHEITEQLKNVFEVSKEGIFYRLKELKLYVSQIEFDESRSQTSLF